MKILNYRQVFHFLMVAKIDYFVPSFDFFIFVNIHIALAILIFLFIYFKIPSLSLSRAIYLNESSHPHLLLSYNHNQDLFLSYRLLKALNFYIHSSFHDFHFLFIPSTLKLNFIFKFINTYKIYLSLI